MDTLTGTLPGGYWDADGTLHRQVELDSLTGRDEELLMGAPDHKSAELVTELLARRIRRLGEISPVPEYVSRRLLVGDREYLLLRLREATFGRNVHAGLVCPWSECGSRVSVNFSIDEIPVAESGDKGPIYSMTLSTNAAPETDDDDRRVRFRLPTGQDQEEVLPWLRVNEAQALTQLLCRCICSIGQFESPSHSQVKELSPLARAEIDKQMQSLAPGIDPVLETRCAHCGRSFLVPFNIQHFFFGELRVDRDLLYREVHYLAYHYHWSETDIMGMPRTARRTYLGVLADEIDRLNDGD
ncbi:MAG: hypothetical protein EOP16_00570 [Pseudonocardia sp.]|nr:MAG: hypothetical protein EOP16_00570 [Pseudonocardia sp.]